MPAGYVALEYLDGSQGYVTTDVSLSVSDILYVDFSFSHSTASSLLDEDNLSGIANYPLVFGSYLYSSSLMGYHYMFALSHNMARYNTIAVAFLNMGAVFSYSSSGGSSSTFLHKSVFYRLQNVYNVDTMESVTGDGTLGPTATTTTTDFVRWTYSYYDDFLGERVSGSFKCSFLRLYQFASYSVFGDLTHNLLPCTNPSGVNGLYDTVDAVFYPVSG